MYKQLLKKCITLALVFTIVLSTAAPHRTQATSEVITCSYVDRILLGALTAGGITFEDERSYREVVGQILAGDDNPIYVMLTQKARVLTYAAYRNNVIHWTASQLNQIWGAFGNHIGSWLGVNNQSNIGQVSVPSTTRGGVPSFYFHSIASGFIYCQMEQSHPSVRLFNNIKQHNLPTWIEVRGTVFEVEQMQRGGESNYDIRILINGQPARISNGNWSITILNVRPTVGTINRESQNGFVFNQGSDYLYYVRRASELDTRMNWQMADFVLYRIEGAYLPFIYFDPSVEFYIHYNNLLNRLNELEILIRELSGATTNDDYINILFPDNLFDFFGQNIETIIIHYRYFQFPGSTPYPNPTSPPSPGNGTSSNHHYHQHEHNHNIPEININIELPGGGRPPIDISDIEDSEALAVGRRVFQGVTNTIFEIIPDRIEGFTGFITAVLPFFPEEFMALFLFGFSMMIAIAIFRMIINR